MSKGSHETVSTRRLLTRNNGLRYSTVMPRSSGQWKTLACSSSLKIACKSKSKGVPTKMSTSRASRESCLSARDKIR